MKKLTLVLLLSLHCILLPAQNVQIELKLLEDEIKTLIHDHEIPSIVVGVVKNGEIIYQGAFGYADLENRILATTDTPYQLASLTKPITATAIMKMDAEGIIDIDDPITQYIPDLELNKVDSTFKTPTIRQVLNHTSGLGTYLDIGYSDEPLQSDSFMDGWRKFGTLFHKPGEKSEYSNLGYGLLDYIISTNSGLPFAEYLRKEVFQPLQMDNSFLDINTEAYRSTAKKYTHDMSPLPSVQNNTHGAGNIYASINDILQFGMFHLNSLQENGVLNQSVINEMQNYREPGALFHYYEDSYYGLGWYIRPDDSGKRIVWHEGGMIGASTMLKLFPDEGIAIAVATNISNNTLCRFITDKISSILIPKYKPSPINEIADYRSLSSDSAFLGVWEGNIVLEEKKIPVTLWLEENEINIQYLDYTLNSYFTEYQPLPNKSSLLFGVVNQNSFIGTGIGLLPAPDLKKEYNHLLSIKLLRQKNQLNGTIMVLPTAEREYYVYPYQISLTKRE